MNTWRWSTDDTLIDNTAILLDFLETEMDPSWIVDEMTDDEGSAEIMTNCGVMYLVRASSDGNRHDHIVHFTQL